MRERRVAGKYTVRLLNVRETDPLVHWFPANNIVHQGKPSARHAISAGGKLGSSTVSRVARISRNFESQTPSLHTMIQPDAPPDPRMPDIQIPQVMVWAPGEITRRKIVPPAPQLSGAIQVKPSLQKPNQELNPAEVSLSATPFITEAPLPAPGTTSPVDVQGNGSSKAASRDGVEGCGFGISGESDLTLRPQIARWNSRSANGKRDFAGGCLRVSDARRVGKRFANG